MMVVSTTIVILTLSAVSATASFTPWFLHPAQHRHERSDIYIPANCTGVSPACARELIRLDNRTAGYIEAVAQFTLDNAACAKAAFNPCWTPDLDGPRWRDGRLAQGSCTIDCERGRGKLAQACAAASLPTCACRRS